MAIPFNPPQELINAYLNRPRPAEVANQGIQQALQTYVQMRAQQDQQKALLDIKNQESQRQNQELGLKSRELFYNYGDATQLPQDIQSQLNNPVAGPANATPMPYDQARAAQLAPAAEGPVQPMETLAPPQKSPIIAHFQNFLAENPSGIKGREKQQSNRPQQAPFLIDGKPATFDPTTSQYAIASVVDPSAIPKPSLPGAKAPIVNNPVLSPRTTTPVNSQFVGTQDGKPVLLNPRTGQMTTGALPGTGPLTSTTQNEGQANAKLYSDRMTEADSLINQLSGQTDLTSAKSGLQGLSPNVMKPESIQKYEQAKRDFINATLRRESGAAISPSEFAEGTKQYFPAFGDKPGVLKQKAQNRMTAINGIRNAGGMSPLSTQSPSAQAPANASTPSPTGMEHLSDEELQRIAKGGA